MYGRGAGTAVTTLGVALLPDTGSNHRLFALATGLVLVGIVIFAATTVMARKSRSEA